MKQGTATKWIGTCEPCDKRTYRDRTSARHASKSFSKQDGRPRPYRCPINRDTWHIGHLADIVRAGRCSRNACYRWSTPSNGVAA